MGRLNPFCSLRRNLVGLRVHDVTLECVAVDGLECAEADVQRELAYLHATRANRGQNLRSEMQPCGGSSYGSRRGRKDRLVSFAVSRFIFTVDVGRKRDVAEPLNLGGDATRLTRSEADGAQPKFAASDNLGFEFAFAEDNALACFHLASGAHERLPNVRADLPGEENLHNAGQVLALRRARGRIRKHSGPAAE